MIKSIVRTLVPVLVGVAASYGVDVPVGALELVVGPVVTVVYYAVVRVLEERVGARFGVLLGAVGAPVYGKDGVTHA